MIPPEPHLLPQPARPYGWATSPPPRRRGGGLSLVRASRPTARLGPTRAAKRAVGNNKPTSTGRTGGARDECLQNFGHFEGKGANGCSGVGRRGRTESKEGEKGGGVNERLQWPGDGVRRQMRSGWFDRVLPGAQSAPKHMRAPDPISVPARGGGPSRLGSSTLAVTFGPDQQIQLQADICKSSRPIQGATRRLPMPGGARRAQAG